jgi:hypothetical protein
MPRPDGHAAAQPLPGESLVKALVDGQHDARHMATMIAESSAPKTTGE